MRFTDFLDQIFGQKSKIKILRFLYLYKKESTIREVSKGTGVTPPNASRILKELEVEGVVIAKKAGRSILHSLNSKHYLIRNIILPVFEKEQKVKVNLAKLFKLKLNFPVKSIILFGSIARKNEKPNSDIDLLFVIPNRGDPEKLREKISALNPLFISYFGNSIAPLIMKQSKFLSELKKGNKLLKSILKDGEVLVGQLISELLCQK